jgi:hypothetical protein
LLKHSYIPLEKTLGLLRKIPFEIKFPISLKMILKDSHEYFNYSQHQKWQKVQ